ncbi:MAG: hypothetical protein HRT52_18885 [Colwellia sp.]|nr:hypothetical protein [Colwellia sp.]
MEFADFSPLSKYENIEQIVLGFIFPLALIIWTLSFLIHSEAIFYFDDLPVYYQGVSAYLVCWFWFGLAFYFFAHFVLSKNKLYYYKSKKIKFYSVTLIITGAFFAFYFAFELQRYF